MDGCRQAETGYFFHGPVPALATPSGPGRQRAAPARLQREELQLPKGTAPGAGPAALHAGSCSPPLRALRSPRGYFTNPLTGGSGKLLTEPQRLWPALESGRPSALKCRARQPRTVGSAVGRTRAAHGAAAAERHRGNGKQRLGRAAGRAKLRREPPFRVPTEVGGAPQRDRAHLTAPFFCVFCLVFKLFFFSFWGCFYSAFGFFFGFVFGLRLGFFEVIGWNLVFTTNCGRQLTGKKNKIKASRNNSKGGWNHCGFASILVCPEEPRAMKNANPAPLCCKEFPRGISSTPPLF